MDAACAGAVAACAGAAAAWKDAARFVSGLNIADISLSGKLLIVAG